MVKEILPIIDTHEAHTRRLIASKFPPIPLFDDVASPEEFDALYELQKLTNPRLQNELGCLDLLDKQEIPWGVDGCNYAVAPFVHLNPEGSRFSDGSFGILYLADSSETALAEIEYHQQNYWSRVEGLHFECFVFRELICEFQAPLRDARHLPTTHVIYDSADYQAARTMGAQFKNQNDMGIVYRSVRHPEGICFGLFTPKAVHKMVQTKHYEWTWDGKELSTPRVVVSI